MATTETRNPAKEVDTVKDELENPRTDNDASAATAVDAGNDQLNSPDRQMTAATNRTSNERAKTLEIAALQQGVAEHPLASVVGAFCAGFLLGKLTVR
jgi:hypothetical protein